MSQTANLLLNGLRMGSADWWIGQNSAAIQAIATVAQGILTVATLWFAIYLANSNAGTSEHWMRSNV